MFTFRDLTTESMDDIISAIFKACWPVGLISWWVMSPRFIYILLQLKQVAGTRNEFVNNSMGTPHYKLNEGIFQFLYLNQLI